MTRSTMLLGAILAAALASAAPQPFVAEFDVAGLSCGSCEQTAGDALRGIRGVTKAEVLFETSRARVEAGRKIDKSEIRRALAKFGFEARFAGDPVLQRLTDVQRARADIRVASRGEAFEIKKHLAPGKFTIFDFWAEWCGPCHVLTPKLEHLALENANIALRTIDLQEWGSAAAKQATMDFQMPGLPYVRVYGPDGRFLGAVAGNDIEKIRQLIARGR